MTLLICVKNTHQEKVILRCLPPYKAFLSALKYHRNMNRNKSEGFIIERTHRIFSLFNRNYLKDMYPTLQQLYVLNTCYSTNASKC